MNLSAFTCITNPKGLNPWVASIESAFAWADEVVIVDGSTPENHEKNKLEFPEAKWIHYPWADDWKWEEWVWHYNKGLESCTGDWAIRFDTDYVFVGWGNAHEIFRNLTSKVATIQKISAVTSTGFYSKGKMPLAINRRYRNICFGEGEVYTDLLVPIEFERDGTIPYGTIVKDREDTGLYFYNYDHVFKTKEQIKKSFLKYSLAHKRFYGFTEWGETEEESLQAFIDMMDKRLRQISMTIPHEEHPKSMQKYLNLLTKDHYGYSAWKD